LRYRGVETKNGRSVWDVWEFWARGGWSIIESPVNGGSKIKSNTFEGSEMNMAGDMDNLEIVVMA
jgi:hypothetical protein